MWEPSPPPEETLGSPASIYEDMPRLEGQEVETQGAACTVAPVPKGRGRHQGMGQQGPEFQQ